MLIVIMTSCLSNHENQNSKSKSEISKSQITTSNDPSNLSKLPTDSTQLFKILNSNDILKIKYGYSFGQCNGLCKTEIVFSSYGIVQEKKSWDGSSNIISIIPISKIKYERIISQINFKDFLVFNKYLGCGDCADGGEEYLTITKGHFKKTILGTYGYSCPPVDTLLNYFRNIK